MVVSPFCYNEWCRSENIRARLGNCGREGLSLYSCIPHVFRPEVMALCQTYDIRFSSSSSLEDWLAATARASMVSAMGMLI